MGQLVPYDSGNQWFQRDCHSYPIVMMHKLITSINKATWTIIVYAPSDVWRRTFRRLKGTGGGQFKMVWPNSSLEMQKVYLSLLILSFKSVLHSSDFERLTSARGFFYLICTINYQDERWDWALRWNSTPLKMIPKNRKKLPLFFFFLCESEPFLVLGVPNTIVPLCQDAWLYGPYAPYSMCKCS